MMQASQEQRQIIDSPLQSQCILAGPGSGKTFVITQRMISLIQRDLVRSIECLALTFGVDASLELKNRLYKSLGGAISSTVTVKTIHALSLFLLKRHHIEYRKRELCSSKEKQLQLVDKAIAPFLLMPEFPKDWGEAAQALWNAQHFLRTNPHQLIHPNYCSWEVILTKSIKHTFEEENLFLFDFLCFDAFKLLYTQSIHLPYRAIFVDEFQDITPTQFALIQCLSPSATTSLTIVGDPNQAIYGWRGASPYLFEKACSHHPEMKQYTLSHTFRCPQKVVDAANFLIANNQEKFNTVITTKTLGGEVNIHRYKTLEEELQATSERISLWREKKVPTQSIAVFARTTDLVQKAILFFHNQQLPIQGENPLQQKEGLQLIALLHFLEDATQLETCINIGSRRLRSSAYRELKLQRTQKGISLEHLLRDICAQNPTLYSSIQIFFSAIDSYKQSKKPIQNRLQDLFQSLHFPQVHSDIPAQDRLFAVTSLTVHVAQTIQNLRQIIETLLEMKQNNYSNRTSILVTTLHKSKGLEFSHVCILGNQNNIFPHFGLTKNNPKLLAEERRLLYVGMTRTKQELYLSNHTAPLEDTFTHRDGFLEELSKMG